MKNQVSRNVRLVVASMACCAPILAQEPPAAPEKPAQDAPAPPKPGNGIVWKVGDTTLKLGGYVKLDLIHDFDRIGSTNSFDPRTIPTNGLDGENTQMQANQTRLNLDVRAPTSTDPLRFFIEGDFEGTGNAFRLRHAYGVMGSVLGGQTWSNFMDEDGMPETLDFESPIGFPQIRQAQARYTTRLESGNSYSFSIEDPAPNIAGVDTTTGRVEATAPDVTANYIWKMSRGHVQVSGFGGVSSYNPDAASSDNVGIWGVNLSTKLTTWGDDNAIVQFTYGDGVGRYRGGITAAPDANGNLEAITTTAVLGSYQHFWSDKYRSTLCYSWAHGDPPAGLPATSSETLQYFAANLIWQFSDRAWTGVEYLYGTNELVDGSDGNATRLQFALRYSL
jgi:hypothetical protein